MRLTRALLLAAGVVLFVTLVVQIGPGVILEELARLGWAWLIILWFPFALITLWDTLGWRFAFARDRVPFRVLLSARLAGEAFNATTPTASVGGEGMKAWLLRAHVGADESIPSVVIAKTTITIAQGLFLLLGLVLGWVMLPAGSTLLRAMEWMLVIEVLAVGGFVLTQVTGLLGQGGRLLARAGLPRHHADALGRVDGALASFYRQHPVRLLLSTACHFLGWAFSALESYVILAFLGRPVSLATAALIEAIGTGVRFATFMIPAHLGALEGGYVATFTALGLEGATGLSFSLVRRIREAFWVGLGFLVMWEWRPGTPAAAPER